MAGNMIPIEKQAGDFLKSLQGTLSTYAVRSYGEERFIKTAMIALVMNKDLQECLTTNEGKASMVNALRMAAGTGLSLNPQEGKAALIAYSAKVNNRWVKTAQYQVMKNGMVELALDSGKVKFITSETVRAADKFTLRKTMSGDEYDFEPARKNRGEPDGFFAAVGMLDGTTHCRYMTIEEVQEHRDKYAKGLLDDKGNPKQGHTWNKSFLGMAEKTVLKRLLRNVHISVEVDQVIGADGWEPEPSQSYEPPPKGASASDLTESLKAGAETAEDAELVDDTLDDTPDDTPATGATEQATEQPASDGGQGSPPTGHQELGPNDVPY